MRVHADGLDPKDATALLGLEPELAALKGGRLRRLPDGGSVIAPTGAVDLVSDRIGKLRNLGADVGIDRSLLISGPEDAVIATFEMDAEALLSLIQAGTRCGAVDIDLPTAGAELSIVHGDRID